MSLFRPTSARSPLAVPARLVAATGVALLVVGCSKAPNVSVTSDSSAASRGIAVSGRGEVSGRPDTVTVSLGVSVKRQTAPAAIADAATAATKLIDALKSAGAAADDIQTTNYSLNQEYAYPDGQPKPDGFRVTNSVVVKVRKVDDVGAVIDAATAAGSDAATVQGLSFSLDDDTAALADAREKAFADAKAKAEQFAKLSGRKLGPVVSIAQQTVPATSEQTPLAAARADVAAPTPVEAGSVTTSVTVDVRWELVE